MKRNMMKRWVMIAFVFCIMGIFMFFYGIYKNDYDHYWMILVGLTLFISFTILIFMFIKDAKRIEEIFKEQNILAHWTFSEYEMDEKLDKVIDEQKKRGRSILLIITIFFVLMLIIFDLFIFESFDEDALLFTEIILAVFCIIAITAYLAPIITRKRMEKSVPEVYIGLYDAWIMGEYVKWKNRFRDVRMKRIDADSFIEVDYFIRQQYGLQNREAQIPIPTEYIEDAQRYIHEIYQANRYKNKKK